MLGVIKEPQTALMISRVDHFLLALVMLGANLHLAYLVCEKRQMGHCLFSIRRWRGDGSVYAH
ncbi:MAG: hypothetical protein R2861_01385 [Desulfobacterales bacterium]